MDILIKKREDLEKMVGEYIFHGSVNLFDIAKPHKAKCDTKNPKNEQFAIYGSTDLRFAVLFSFPKMPLKNYAWGVRLKEGKFVGVLNNNTYIEENAKGYIYCFNKKHFKPIEKGSSQYVCKYELCPEYVFEIKYKDFKDCFKKEKTELKEL